MNKITLSIFCICLSLTLSAIGQNNFQQKQENTKTIKNKMTEDELKTYYKSIHSRLPLKRENISLKSENDFSKSQKTGKNKGKCRSKGFTNAKKGDIIRY